ncbi:MAG: aldose 1-epimerase family protein [Planctomycetota bacterium]|jgi:hypothetical protein
MAEYFEKVLTDAGENLAEDTYELSSENFVGYDGPPWHIRKFTLAGGKQDGVGVVEVHNGCITVVVVPTRGMGVLEAFSEDVSLGWDSPVRQLVHPAFVRPAERDGLGWLTGFSELVCRCGLSYHGAPCEDVVEDETGAERRMQLTLHGTIANAPATRVAVRVQLGPPYELAVVGEVPDAALFGPSLQLVAAISTLPGSSEFAIRDVVENLSATPAEMELLYHCNFGPPLLDEGARLLAPVAFVCPLNRRAEEGITHWDTYGAPEAGFREQCYFAQLYANDQGNTVAALVNPAEDLAAVLRYSTAQLPAFTLWKNTAALADGYVTGLEPGTDYPNPRPFERSNGRVVVLPGQGSYEAGLTMGLVTGAEEVASLKAEVARLAEGRESTVRETPDAQYCPA